VVLLLKALSLVLSVAACGEAGSDAPDVAAPVAEDSPATPMAATSEVMPEATELLGAAPPLAADQEIEIPRGVVHLGTLPGSEGRDPRREADHIPVPLSSFHVDRLPYPNDPAAEVLMGISRAGAEGLCAAEGKRLCTEVEWERACDLRGIDDMAPSAFEWTSSDVTAGLGSTRYSAVVRGARPDDTADAHRCASRHALDPTEADAAFRCCRGEPTEREYPAEERRHPFRDRAVAEEELRGILATMPELARFAPRFSLFDAESIDAALARGDAVRDGIAWTLVEGVLVWSPEHGEEAWVFAGSDGESTLLAVIHPMPDGSFVHGSSFVIAGEEAPPIALGWDYGLRRQVLWGASWLETGESGVVEHRDDHRIVIVQR